MENPTLMRSYSVRPMFVGGCLLAMKLARDDELKLRELHERLDDVLRACRMGDIYNVYARVIFETASQELGVDVHPPPLLQNCA